MEYVLYAVIIVALLAAQQFLSTRKQSLFGAILPLLVIPFTVWAIISRSLEVNFSTILPFAALFVVLLSVWVEGRQGMRKKAKIELEKMKAKDIEE